ncbi:sugar isomerase [Bacillus anthracis]|nr:sugar isomerase [Bacillus anthracis]
MAKIETIRTPRVGRLALLLILSTLLGAYNISVGFSLKPYMILTCFILLISIFNFKIHKLMTYEILMLAFYFLYCSTGLFAKYPVESLRLIVAIIITVSSYFVMKYVLSRISIRQLENTLAVSGIIFNMVSLILYVLGAYLLGFHFAGNRITSLGLLMDRGIPRLIGTFTDPNIFAFCNFIFFYYYLTHLKRKGSRIGLLLTVATLLLTFSRGAFVAVAFGFFLYFVAAKTKTKIRMIIWGSIFGAGAIYFAQAYFNIDVISIVTARFTEVQGDGASGRFDIWGNGLKLFSDSPFLGIGIYNYRAYSNNMFGIDHYMHNTFLEVLTESGMIGFVLYALFFLGLFRMFYKNRKQKHSTNYLFFTLCSMGVMMSSLSLISNENFFLFLAVCWRYFYENKKLQMQKNEIDNQNSKLIV